MLNKNEMELLEKCMTQDHAIIEIELYETNSEKEELRDKFNSGEHLTIAEMFNLPCSSILIQTKINDKKELSFIKSFSIQYGKDLQPLFEIEDQPYLSLFISHKDVDIEFQKILKEYKLLDHFLSSKDTGICISFPEIL